MPKIQAEPRADRRAGRARPDLMIMDILSPDGVLNVKSETADNENILKTCEKKFELCYMLARCTENRANALYISNRVFAGKIVHHVNTYHGILSGHDEDKEKVAAFLALYFCHRTDCCAVQIYSMQHQKWEFIRTDGDLNDYTLELVKKHLRADVSGIDRRFTMGVYQIDPDTDTVSWICYDLDRHKPKDPGPKEAVQRLLSVLTRYHIPYLLESSGSPDSYHVWVFLVPTKTSNAYCFSRLIAKAAKLDCEIWPKQQTHSGRSGKDFGNLVKLPLAYHNKTGNRSCFIDPETFEPLEYVSFPGLVRLFELPILDSETKAKQKSKVQSSAKSNATNSDFRPCLKAVLESGHCLEGSEGNDMRVAIGAEAKCAGIPIEEATKMFSPLPDFDEKITRGYLEYIYGRQYNRLRCDTILEKSGSIIAPYCMKCTRPRASENLTKCGRATA